MRRGSHESDRPAQGVGEPGSRGRNEGRAAVQLLAPRPGYRQRLRYALSGEVYRQLPLDHLLLVGFLLLDCL